MKSDDAAISVIGAVLLVGLCVVSAGIIGFVVVNAITDQSYNGPQTSLDISNVKNMMYHSGGESIDWMTSKVLYEGDDITKYCKMADYGGGEETPLGVKTWSTGQVLIIYDSTGRAVDAEKVSIVATDGTQDFMVYKGSEYSGSTQTVIPVWTVIVYYKDDKGNELSPSKKIQVARDGAKGLIYPIPIKNYVTDTEPLDVSTVNSDMSYTFNYRSDGLSLTLHLLGGDLSTEFGKRYYDPDDICYIKSDLSEGNVVELPPADKVSRDGYIFLGWYDNPEGSGTALTSVTMGTESVDIYPKWEKLYSVTLFTNGGDLTSTEFVKVTDSSNANGPVYRDSGLRSGDKIVLPDESSVTKENYIFKGWCDNPYGTGTFYSGEITVTDDLKLYLIWEEKEKYTISFDSNGGSKIEPITVYNGTTPTKPADPTYNENKFIGWFDEEGNEYNFDEPLEGDIKLKAKWSYKITFDANGGKWSDESTQKYRYTNLSGNGLLDDLPNKPENAPEGKVFVGWYYMKDGKEIEVNSNTVFDSDVVVYAKWDDRDKVTVTFDPNGGLLDGVSGPVTIPVYKGDTVSKPQTDPVYNDNKFLGWYNEDGTAYDFSLPVSKDTKLVAKWGYKVTFNPKEGTMPNEDKTRYTDKDGKLSGPSDSENGIPADPTKSGSKFIGWYYKDADGNEHEFTKDTVLTKETEVYAKWSTLYTITFDPNGGIIDGSTPGQKVTVEVSPGTKVTEPSVSYDPNKFLGWYDQNGNKFDFSKPVTGDVVLTAKWSYKITFHPEGGYWYDSNGEKTTADQVYYTDINGYVTDLPSEPGKNSNLFRGWYTQKGGAGTQVTKVTPKFTSAADVYAKWVAGCRVIFHPCGHKWPATASSTYAGTTKIITVDVEGASPTAVDAITELITNKLQLTIPTGYTQDAFYMPSGTSGNDWRELNIITQPYSSKYEPSPYWLSSVWSTIARSSSNPSKINGDHTVLSWASHSGIYPIVFGADDYYLEERAHNDLVDEGLIVSKKCKYVN